MQKIIKGKIENLLRTWIDTFISRMPYWSNPTRKTYRYILIRFAVYLADSLPSSKKLPLRIDQKVVMDWLNALIKHLPIRTVSFWIVPINRFLAYLREKQLLEENPIERLVAQYPKEGLNGIVRAIAGDNKRQSLEALKLSPLFSSVMGHSIQQFIEFERSLGKGYENEEWTLRKFDRFLKEYPLLSARLSAEIHSQWLNSLNGLHPTTQYTNFLLIRKFCVYLRRTDPEAYVPGEWNGPHGKQFIPHIYSQSELIRLLKGAAELKASPHCPLRPQMIRLLIVLLYTAGLRLGEALKLTLCDINWNDRYIHIRETKFYKSRLVPLSCSAMKELDSYVQLSQRSGIPSSRDSPVFQNRHTRSPYSAMCMRHIFRHLCRHLGIKTLAGRVPRLHDLRHTFAVNRVEEWYRKGDDVQSKLGLLSTYMGHTGLEGTQRYLTMTSDLLQKASERFEGFFEINRKGMLK